MQAERITRHAAGDKGNVDVMSVLVIVLVVVLIIFLVTRI